MKMFFILLMSLSLQAKIVEVKQLFNYKTVAVKKSNYTAQKTFYAKTAIDEQNIFAISLRYDAFVNKLYANKRYQLIQKGDKLFNLYSKEVSAVHQEYLISKSISNRAKKNALLKLELLELKSLAKNSKAVYDFDVLSPYSGFIVEKNILDGGFIKRGKKVLEIADFSRLWVIAKVYQKDIHFVKKGMSALVEIEGFEKVLGKVDFIYPVVDSTDQSISVRIVIENKEQVYFPNLFAKVHLKQKPTTKLLLPKTAVLKKSEGYYVFVPVGKVGEFEPKKVEAKRVDAQLYEITSGLKEGEKVIDNALFMVDSDAMTNALYESEDDSDW